MVEIKKNTPNRGQHNEIQYNKELYFFFGVYMILIICGLLLAQNITLH